MDHYEKVRNEVKLASGDYIDLKMYEPAMRHLIDTYIRAEESEKISAFDDMSLVQLIVERGADAVEALPEGIRENKEAVAETIENNVRKLIIDEQPINPKYYEKMSELLDALIEQRRTGSLDYQKYLEADRRSDKKDNEPHRWPVVPEGDSTPQQSGHFMTTSERTSHWRLPWIMRCTPAAKTIGAATRSKSRKSSSPSRQRLKGDDALTEQVLELVKNQNEY